MANQIYNDMMGGNRNPFGISRDTFIQNLQKLKSMGGDPNQKIQELLNSGRVTQEQYNQAVQRAQYLKNYFGL